MGINLADAFVGALVGELLKTVLEMKDKAVKFRPTLEKLQSTLERLGTDVDMIEEQIRRLKRSEAETATMKELLDRGTKLVQECSKESKRWNCFFKKVHYQEKLEALDNSIFRYFQLDMQAQMFKCELENLAEIQEFREEFRNAVAFLRNERVELRSICVAPEPPSFMVGLDVPLNELKKKLLREEVSVSVTTVTGLRGVGKTTLARKFCWDEEVKGKFKENILYVTFGKMPKFNTIVQKLLRQVPHEFQSDKDDAYHLENLLTKIGKKGQMLLLVLDDVWVGSESLVDKFVFPIPNYKVLITSRFPIIRFGRPHVLEPLDEADATKLFCNSASLNQSNFDISVAVEKIVRSCSCSPLALTVTGKSLCHCHQKLMVWQNKAKAFSTGDSNLDNYYYKNVFTCLQKSLDILDPRTIECFKDLGLFPETQRIPMAALVDMWVELHGEDDAGALERIWQMVNLNMADITVIGKFASDTNDYNNHYVTQHSLLRELAILQTSKEPKDKRKRLIIENNGNNILAMNEYPIAAHILSISIDEAFSSNWCNLQQLPTEVEALVLNLQGKKLKLPMLIKKMNKLRVLIITNYDFFPAELENFELLDNLFNLKRLRLEKVLIPFLSKTGVQFKNLQKCSFYMCNVNETFLNATTQVSDMMLPNLVEMNFDYCTMVELPVVLSNSVSLNKLRITNCHKLSALPEGIEKLVNLVTLRLSSCTGLLKLPDSITKLQSLQFLDISNCISLSELPEHIGELSNLEKLNVRGCSRLTKLPPSIIHLGRLKNVVCDEQMAEFWESFKASLSDLQLHVTKADFNLDFLYNLSS